MTNIALWLHAIFATGLSSIMIWSVILLYKEKLLLIITNIEQNGLPA